MTSRQLDGRSDGHRADLADDTRAQGFWDANKYPVKWILYDQVESRSGNDRHGAGRSIVAGDGKGGG
jgi:hypothetical protein